MISFLSKRSTILIALILSLSIFPVLGLPKLSSSSEARETHIASIIRTTGEWILPDRNGFVPSKPLLHHWLAVAASYLTGSVNELTGRLPSAVLGILLVLALHIFSRRIFYVAYKNSAQAEKLALLTTASLLTTYGFFSMLFVSMVDMTFSFFVVSSLLLILRPIFEQKLTSQDSIEISQSTWALFYICCGLATLAKGPLGLLLPCCILGVMLWSLFGLKRACNIAFKPKWGWIFYLLLALPWYYLAANKAKSAFVERQLVFENVKRFFGGDNVNYEPFWFYIPSFFSRAAPWAEIFLGFVIWFIFNKKTQNASIDICKALLKGLVVVLIFFSLSSGKRHSYLLPLFPFFSLCGVWIYSQLQLSAEKTTSIKINLIFNKFFNSVVYLVLLLIIAVSIGVFFIPAMDLTGVETDIALNWIYSNLTYLFFAPFLAILLLLISRFITYPKELIAVIKLFLVSAFSFSSLSALYGIKATYKDYPLMATKIIEQAGGREVVAVRDRYDELLDPIFYYLNLPISVLDPLKMQGQCLSDKLYISKKSNLDILASAVNVKEELLLQEKVGKPSSLEKRAISAFTCSNRL